jgi:hypothetical protein
MRPEYAPTYGFTGFIGCERFIGAEVLRFRDGGDVRSSRKLQA